MNEMEAGVLCELSDLYAEYGDRAMLLGMARFAEQRAEFLNDIGGSAFIANRWDDIATSVRLALNLTSLV